MCFSAGVSILKSKRIHQCMVTNAMIHHFSCLLLTGLTTIRVQYPMPYYRIKKFYKYRKKRCRLELVW